MAESVNPLVLPIKVDTSQVATGVQALRNRLNELRNNAQQAAQGIAQTGNASSTASTGVAQLGNQAAATSNQLNQLTNTSTRARTALTSLSLVAQDAPFGFIALQNNLPAVIQQFGLLRAEAGSNGAAFKQLAASLVGPAGAFLAFSIGTAIVTKLVKDYGSLTAALKSFVNGNSLAVKSQNDFNKAFIEGAKSIGGEEAQIKILTKTLTSETATQKERIAAYRLAIKESPNLVAGINEQNLATEKSINLIKAASSVQLEYLKLRAQEGGILKVLDGLKEQEFQANGKYIKERQKELELINFIEQAKQKRKNNQKLSTLEINTLASQNIQLDAQAKRVKEASDEIADITTQQNKWTGSLEKSYESIGKTISGVQDLNDKLKAEKEASDKAAKSARDLAKARAEQFKFAGDIRQLRNQDFLDFDPTLKPIKKVDAKTYVESFTKSINELPATKIAPTIEILFPEEEFKKIAATWSKINADTAPKLEEFKNNIRDALINKELVSGVKTTYEDVQKAITDAITKLQTLLGADAQITQNFANAIMKGANEFTRLQEQVKEFDKLKSSIESNLTRPFRDFFDELLTNGKVAFDGFVQLAKDAFKRILAQAIASGIATLLVNILTGGAGGAIGTLGAAKGISSILSGLGKTGGLFGSANFSGVQGGAMQMAGAVNLQLRGSDLVASINRTNSTINRVG